ncbi:hypothetical protein ATHSA_1450 [Athalassotoga saccharophila]|nr:hypothetical protein ATHSA_1450 [Athalassotoga saccharophila]
MKAVDKFDWKSVNRAIRIPIHTFEKILKINRILIREMR